MSISSHLQDSSVPVDVETALFPRQRIPPSPSHSLYSLSNVTSHPDIPTTGSSQPDLRGVPSHLSLHGSGLAGGPPSQLSAGAHAADGSLLVEEMQSLHALCKFVENVFNTLARRKESRPTSVVHTRCTTCTCCMYL